MRFVAVAREQRTGPGGRIPAIKFVLPYEVSKDLLSDGERPYRMLRVEDPTTSR